jgi:hypothetical protein
LLIGDLHGLNTLKHQPVKVAAMEAHWESDKPVDFHIFAWPDETAETNRWALSIPNAGSLVLTHRLNGLIIGLKDVAPQNRPPVKTVFFAFRIMLAIGFFMIAAALVGAWLLWRGILLETRWYLRIVAHSWWTGFVAVIAGWVVTESGRCAWVGHAANGRRTSAGGIDRTHDTDPVRDRLRHRVHDGHLLHQPADRTRAAGRRGEGPRARFAVAAAIIGARCWTRGLGTRFLMR